MADKKLAFVFQIVDKLSGPASKMSKSLERLEKAFGGAASGASKLSKMMSKSGMMGGGLARTQRGFAGARKEAGGLSMTLQGIASGGSILGSIAGAAFSAVGTFVDLATSIGKGVAQLQLFGLEAADFKEKSLIGFKTFLGGDLNKAKELFSTSMDFARTTPFETQDTIDLFNKLATAGFQFNKNMQGISEIEVAAKAIGDLASVRGGGAETISRVTMALAQIKSKGKLRAEELTGQLGEAGLQTGKVLDNIAKNLGKTRAEVDKMMQGGKIDADTGIFAIIQTLKETTSGGKLGGPMKELSHTMGGLWSTIKSAPFDMLVDIDKGKGVKSAKGFLENVANALNPNTSAGKKVKARVEALMDDMLGFTFGGGAGTDGAERIAAFIDSALDTFQAGWDGIKTVVTSIVDSTNKYLSDLGKGDTGKGLKMFAEKVVSGIGNAAEGLAKLVPAMTKVFELIIDMSERLVIIDTDAIDTNEEVSAGGKKLGIATPATDALMNRTWLDELSNPLGGAVLSVDAAIERGLVEKYRQAGMLAGEGMESGFKEALEIHSPSKVFEQLGLMTTKGFEQGLMSGSTSEMVGQMLGLGGAEGGAGSAVARGGIQVGDINVIVNVDGQGSPQETAEAVAKAVPEALMEALERLNMEQP